MKFLLSLDYELFFGETAGGVDRCMIEPTEAILAAVRPHGVRVVFFVDATFLLRLREIAGRVPSLRSDFDRIRRQLARAAGEGHEVQLHVHPHWVDSRHDGTSWRAATGRYRLHDFEAQERERIVLESKALLEETAGAPVFAFRAGGWCLQPFPDVASALSKAGIWLDSTVYVGGISRDPGREHDFRGAPRKSSWRFHDDPSRECADGEFLEVPISSFLASPLLFWRMALAKRDRSGRHRTMGGGAPMRHGGPYYLRRLLLPSRSVASVDGMKAGTLPAALSQCREHPGSEVFHVMGHPKSLTPHSLACLTGFLEQSRGLEPATLGGFPRPGRGGDV